MRFRDRRSLIAALVLVAAYAALALTVLLWFAGRPFEAGQAVSTLLLVNAVLLAWRAAIRATVVTRLHGSSEGLRAVPRMVVSNIVAMMAAWRAIGLYVRMVRTGMIAWDKTDHHFPGLGSVS
jgi:adsorption protein B